MSGPQTAPDIRRQFESGLAFPLDPFQRQALDALDRGHSVLVAAPTGSGKTVVAEYAVAAARAQGRKAFYTTPIKALSNQKFQELREAYGGDEVGLLTGDNAIGGEAPIVVMTTEVLRNMIYEGSPTLDGLGVVVLDEVHYLQDPYRGAVWEEIIVHLAPEVLLVCLSATVSNAEEFGDWLATARGGTEVVIEERRPVELDHLYGVAFRDAPELLLLPTFVTEKGTTVPNPKGSGYDPAPPSRGRRPPPSRGRGRPRPVAPRRVEVVEELHHRDMLPAIYFIFSRAACDDAVVQCQAAQVELVSPESRPALREIGERHCEGLSDSDLDALGYGPWLAALEAGVAAHHAGMVPPMKEAVEEAFQRGLVRVVFATETLALGVNMPARSVVIERLTKFTGERHELLTPGQYTQLTGRAGRRGIDDRGYGVVLWNRFVRFDQVASLASKRAYELTSSFRPTYNMAVNLVHRHSPGEAHHLLNLSFAQFRVDRDVVALERQADQAFRRLESARGEASCELGDVREYQELLQERERRRRARARDDTSSAALTRLRPGDVVDAGGRVGRVVVLQRATGRGGSARITALNEGAKTIRLGPNSFRRPPEVVGRVRLPDPFRPKNPGFRREAAQRLRRVEAAPRRARRPGPDDAGVSRLDQQIDRHPVKNCPDLARHLEALGRLSRLERQADGARKGADGRAETLSRRFDQVLGVLERRGYVDDWSLTDAGSMLSRLYSETDLLVAEAIRAGVFEGLAPEDVAAVASLFTFETRGPEEEARPRWPTADTARRAHQIEDLWASLRADEAAAGLPETRPPDGGFTETAHAWASGRDLDRVLTDDDDLTGGDFVRNMKQLIDLLRQLADVVPDGDTARSVRAAASALFRGVVEASSRVGT